MQTAGRSGMVTFGVDSKGLADAMDWLKDLSEANDGTRECSHARNLEECFQVTTLNIGLYHVAIQRLQKDA
jgi:hypothetical protein